MANPATFFAGERAKEMAKKANSVRWAAHPRAEIICAVCAAHFTVPHSRSKTAKYCSLACHQIGEGRKGGTIRGEQLKAKSQGKAYAKTNGRHTHRVVAEQELGRSLVPGEVVHHKDGDILNNAPDNLEVLPSQAEHTRRHHKQMLEARKEKHGH